MALQEDDLSSFKESYKDYRNRKSEIAKNRFLGYFLTTWHRVKNRTGKYYYAESRRKRIKKKYKETILTISKPRKRVLKNFKKYYE